MGSGGWFNGLTISVSCNLNTLSDGRDVLKKGFTLSTLVADTAIWAFLLQHARNVTRRGEFKVKVGRGDLCEFKVLLRRF